MKTNNIKVGGLYELRLRRRAVLVRVTSRVVVRGEWWNCLELETGNTRLAHCTELVREHVEVTDRPLSQRRRRLAKATVVAAIMPLCYILSIGPVYGMQQRESLSERVFDTVYWPLLKLADWHDSINAVLARYAEWWV